MSKSELVGVYQLLSKTVFCRGGGKKKLIIFEEIIYNRTFGSCLVCRINIVLSAFICHIWICRR